METIFEKLSSMANVGMEIEQAIRVFSKNYHSCYEISKDVHSDKLEHKCEIYCMCIIRLESRLKKQLQLIKELNKINN